MRKVRCRHKSCLMCCPTNDSGPEHHAEVLEKFPYEENEKFLKNPLLSKAIIRYFK